MSHGMGERRRAIQEALVNSLTLGTPFAEALVAECAMIGHRFAFKLDNTRDIVCVYCGTEREE